MLIPGSRVLDLFAGSGSLGIEAISRGAGITYFIDKSNISINLLNENISLIKDISGKYMIFKQDAADFISLFKGEPFDIIFLDPPFKIEADYMKSLFKMLHNSNIIDKNSVIIYEFFFKRNVMEEIGLFNVEKVSLFGEKKVIYLKF